VTAAGSPEHLIHLAMRRRLGDGRLVVLICSTAFSRCATSAKCIPLQARKKASEIIPALTASAGVMGATPSIGAMRQLAI
jgi:hypothetical protein